jgi:hypothetical protein
MVLQDLLDMVLQRESGSRFPAILDAERKFDEGVDVFAEAPINAISHQVTL